MEKNSIPNWVLQLKTEFFLKQNFDIKIFWLTIVIHNYAVHKNTTFNNQTVIL